MSKEEILQQLELLFRKTGLACERDTFNNKTCANCIESKESRCSLYLAYRSIQEYIKEH